MAGEQTVMNRRPSAGKCCCVIRINFRRAGVVPGVPDRRTITKQVGALRGCGYIERLSVGTDFRLVVVGWGLTRRRLADPGELRSLR